MNERLKQLASECHGPYSNFDHKKFNELIIQDCIRTLHSNGYDDAAQCLQEIHFGIDDPV